MKTVGNPTSQKLMTAFMQFAKAEWHQRSFMGYKPSEIRVLFCVRHAQRCGPAEIKVSEISKKLHVTSPSVTQILKRLEAGGLIERHSDPSDRRSVGITLTAKGEQITQYAADDVSTSINGLVEYLGEEQSELFAELLTKTFRYYSEKAANENNSYWRGDEDA